jgi:hypothetical protein
VTDFDVALERLVSEPEFREALAADPQRALAGYRLSPDELEVLTSQVDTGSGGGQRHVEQRTSKASLFGLLSPMSGMGGFLSDDSGASAGASFGTDTEPGAGFGTEPHSGASFGAEPHSGASFGAEPDSGASFGTDTESGASFGSDDYQPRHGTPSVGAAMGSAGDFMSEGGVQGPVLDNAGHEYHTRVDANGDGRWDQFTTIDRGNQGVDLAVDRNNDGRVDWVGHDLDRDGLIDEASVDHDYDGTLETRWVDQNGDGWLDTRQPWEGQGPAGSGDDAAARHELIEPAQHEERASIEHPREPR